MKARAENRGNGEFVNRSRLRITSITIDDDNSLTDDAKDVGGAATISEWATRQFKDVEFVDGDIGGDATYQYEATTCKGNKTILDASVESVDSGQFTISYKSFWLKNESNKSIGTDGCFLPLGAAMGRSGELKITLNTTNKDIWFYATDANTLKRVDGAGGTFSNKVNGNNNVRFFERTEDGEPKCDGSARPSVTLQGSDTIGDKTRAYYDTCINSRGFWGRGEVDVTKNEPPPPPTSTDDETTEGAAPTCESRNPQIIVGWLVCSFINLLDEAVDSTTNLVNDMLLVDGEDLNNEEALKQVWSLFRAVSSFALIAVAMAMIIGQAIGGDH